jgi:hypothetical protein
MVSGRVFCGEKGVGGVVVTDGYDFTSTASDGTYSLPVDYRARFVYISTPSGYLPPCNGSRPLFYKRLAVLKKKAGIGRDVALSCDFELYRNPYDDFHHTFAVDADVQMTSFGELNSFKPIYEEQCRYLDGISGDKFVLDCGDIVGDSPQIYPGYLNVTDAGGYPSYRTIGNHDMNYYGPDFESSYTRFESYFGPVCYSFNRGRAHYLVVDDCFYFGRDYYYMGYFDHAVLDFIRHDLEHVPKDRLLIVLFHIPASLTEKQLPFEYSYSPIADQCVNATALYDLVKGYDTHLISGHMHYNLNIVHSDSLYEHNTAAVCGTWWCGDICLDGTPQGYGIYTVDGTGLKWTYRSAGHDPDYQFRAYPVGDYSAIVPSGNSSVNSSEVDFSNCFVVNVWNWDKAWKVEWYENGILAGSMRRFTGLDPAALALCSDKKKIKYDWISPIPNGHMFAATPKDPDARIEIRVTDRFGKVVKAPVGQASR